MIVRSRSADVTVPNVSVTEYVLRHARRLGDKPALIDGPTGRTLTYGQLADGVRRVAAGLARRGFKKGDVLAIYSPNLPEYAVVFHAVRARWAPSSPPPIRSTRADELAKQLVDAGARLLVTVPPFLDKASEAAAQAPASRRSSSSAMAEGAAPFAELLRARRRAARGRHRPARRPRRAARTRAAPRACPRA